MVTAEVQQMPDSQGPQHPSVAPQDAQGAQIPLRDFNVPSFPPEASSLRALTLTSDIKLDEYQTTLSQPFKIPSTLPTSIESLTLELFSLGYPAGFLSTLADRLPNLKSLLVYSQLFAGISEESQKDAVEFFRKLPGLRALHLLDVFAKPHFFERAAPYLKPSPTSSPPRRGLMFLEINYTFRHEDEEFMSKIQAPELPLLIGSSLVSLSFNLAEPENVSEDEQDPTTIQGAGNKEGIMAFNKTLTTELVDALTVESENRPTGLRALNTTLYTLTPEQIGKILEVQNGVLVLGVTAEVDVGEASKKALLNTLEKCKDLEQVEIVSNPSLNFFLEIQNPKKQVLEKTFPDVWDMNKLSEKLEKLSSFKANVLRTKTLGTIDWERINGQWKGGFKPGSGLPSGTITAT